MSRFWLAIAAIVLGFATVLPDAQARRLGGGRTLGVQRNLGVAPPAAAPARQAQPAPATAPAAAGSKWMPILGGLAIGGLFGALFAGNPVLGSILAALMIGMLVFAALALLRMLRAPRAGPQLLQYAGLGNETVAAPPPSQAAGFDLRFAEGSARPNVPAGFDVAGFLRVAKNNFIRLQIANDSGRMDQLRDVTTPEMFEALRQDAGAAGQQTDVVTLNADLLEAATEGDRHRASVRFSGLVRETAGTEPAGFAEVWNLVKPVDGSSGWRLAGIQQTH